MNSSFTRPTRFILAQNFISADPFRNTCGMSGWGTWALLTPASEKVQATALEALGLGIIGAEAGAGSYHGPGLCPSHLHV